MEGYIKLHRQIAHNILWSDKPFSRGQAWIDLLIMANYKDNECMFDGSTVTVKAGQRITSLHKLSDRWGWSIGKVGRFLDLLASEKMIQQKRDTKKTLISIVNYGLYQNGDTPTEHRKNTDGTQKELNKKDKNDKNKEEEVFKKVVGCYQKNIRLITQIEAEKIQDWLNDVSAELICKAIEVSVANDARNWSYINTCLTAWHEKGLLTAEQVDKHIQDRKQKKAVKKVASYNPVPQKGNFEQREYSDDFYASLYKNSKKI